MGKFDKLHFKDFAKMAKDVGLSQYNKIGFDDEYRRGYEGFIFNDIIKYLPALNRNNKSVLDIGPGCSDLPFMLINFCYTHNHKLTLIDSTEMLSLLPDSPHVNKIEGIFPECSGDSCENYDAIIVYSVMHHVFFEMNPFTFIDRAVEVLLPDGALFLGDIPNYSKKIRSFKSGDEITLGEDVMEDGFIFAILQRYRNAGYETYLVPHDENLPLASTRDNILITR